jgi:hypothetical protein
MAKKNNSTSNSLKKLLSPASTRGINDITKPIRGMSTDSSPLNQIPLSYRFALNMLMESKQGDYSSLTNEEGNEICFALEVGEKLIGTILINNGDTILFIAQEDGDYSKISILNEKCELTNLIKASCLNFNKKYPVSGTWRLNNGCDRNIYFTDNFNTVRAINLDNLGQYTPKVGASPEDWIIDANTNDTWLCDLFNQNGVLQIPSIDFDSVGLVGGSLRTGAYYFAIRYLTEDFNPSNWFYITNPFTIGPKPPADNAHINNSDGGEVGIPDSVTTGKIINLQISNLDTTYAFYQLAVIEYLDQGLTLPTNIYELKEVNIISDTDTFQYLGSEQGVPTTLDSITVPKIIFDTVKSIGQIDNRLVFANTAQIGKDWGLLQQTASKIHVTWRSDFVKRMTEGENSSTSFPEFSDSTEQADSSTAEYSFRWKSFARDEVYALGIVFVFKDGSESPAFHIPGRPADFAPYLNSTVNNTTLITYGNNCIHNRNQVPAGQSWDKQLLTVISSATVPGNTEVREKNVKHIPLTEFVGSPAVRLGSQIERWKVYNTATLPLVTPAANRHTFGTGIMAFYEGNQTYPDIRDCNNVSIWGNDLEGNPLAGQTLRHHKFPDIMLAKIDDADFIPLTGGNTTNIYPINITISNLDIPTSIKDNIQGFYMVRSKRNEIDKTVLDTGYLGGTTYVPSSGGIPAFLSAGKRLNDEIGAPNNVGGSDQVCTFISPRTQFRKDLKSGLYFKFEEKSNSSLSVITMFRRDADIAEEEVQFRNNEGFAYVDKEAKQNQFSIFPSDLNNALINIDLFFVHLEDPKPNLLSFTGVPGFAEHYFCSIKKWTRPYEDIFELSYEKIGNGISTNIANASDITNLNGGGDCYLGDLSFRTLQVQAKTQVATANPGWNFGVVWNYFYCQSEINSEKRMTGEEDYEKHWRFYSGNASNFLDLIQFESSPGVGWSLDYFVENRDMNKGNDLRLYFPLARTFDFCSNCFNNFPTRIWYSQRDYQETPSDNYRIFLANDYRDLIGKGGEITNLFTYKDELYAQTPLTTWFVPTKPQQLTTNENNISVGTGDILAVPPKRLETVDRGYAGNQDRFSTVVTEFGTTWVDAEAGKVFNFNKQLNELSAFGMRNWFVENLKLSGGINDQIEGFNIDSTIHKNGIGFIGTFDPRHNRYILRKKYYKIIDPAYLAALVVTGEYIFGTSTGFNTSTGEFYTWLSGPSPSINNIHINFSIVEDLSWTISYSYPHQVWASYHSYKSNWLWHNRDALFSYSNDTFGDPTNRYGWKHGSINYGQFYNKVHPTSLYLIFNKTPVSVKTFNNVELITSSFNWVGNELVEREDDSFDEVFLHTGRQSSNILNVDIKNSFDLTNPFISLNSNLSEITVQNNEGNWNYSKFYDLTSDYTLPIMTSDWNNVLYQNKRSIDGYIYYPNTVRNDFNKNLYQVSPLRDKWLGCFMTYSNEEAYKFIIDYVATLENISFK